MRKVHILFITLMACLMFLPMVSATFENQFIHQYNLENGNDVNGTLTLTNDGASFVAGKFLNGVYFNGATQDLSGAGTPLTSAQIQSNWTINFWLNQTSRVNDSQAFSFITGATGQTIRFHPQASGCTGSPAFGGYDGTSFTKCFTGRPSYLNQWVMYTLVYNVTTGNILVYENTVNTINISMGAFGSTGRCGTGVTLGQEGNCGALGSNVYTGMMDSLGFWATTLNKAEIDNLYLSQSPFATSSPANNVSITLTDFYTGTSLTNFSATAINASGYQFNGTTTNGTLNNWTYPFYQNSTSLWNITLTSTENGGYFSKTLLNQNVASTIATTLSQSITSFTASEFISNATISTINFSTQYLTNTTHYMRAQSYVINTSKTGYFNKSQTVTPSALSTTTVNIENVTATYLNVTMRDNITNVLQTNFTVILNNPYWNYTEIQSTTTGAIVVPSISGTWSIIINDTYHGYNVTSVTLVTGMNNITLYSYATNSIYFYIYDEVTRNLINYTTVNIELIGSLVSYNQTTTNGTWFKSLIVPSIYTIRTSASGYTTRFYNWELTNQSTNTILLYLLNSSLATNITVSVVDLSRGGAPLEGASVYIQKYNILTNTYITREIVTTNFEGESVFSAQLNSEYYKFIVQFPFGTTLTETTPSYINSNSITIPVSTLIADTQVWQTVLGISGDVSFNQNTRNFRFAYVDPSNSISTACLYVYNVKNNFTTSLANSSCSTSHSATILLNVQNLSMGNYFAKGVVTIQGVESIIDTESFSFSNMLLWGTLGIFLSAIIAIVMQMMFKNPIASLIVTPLPTLAFTVAGITALPLTAVIGLCIVCWVAAIIAARWA